VQRGFVFRGATTTFDAEVAGSGTFRVAFWKEAVMKKRTSEYYDLPELEESEFAFCVSPCHRIEDANDIGEIGDSFSIGLDLSDELPGNVS
jgi:hypothetical protein